MDDALSRLADECWEANASWEPSYYRHLLGDYSEVGRFEDASRSGAAAFADRLRSLAQRAGELDPDTLDAQEQVTRDLVVSTGSATATFVASRWADLVAKPIRGIQSELPLLVGLMSVPDQSVADQMPDKLDSVGRHLRQLADRAREAAADGWVPPDFLVRETVAQIEATLATPVGQDAVVGAVTAAPGVDADALRESLTRAVERAVRPGLAGFRDALLDVLPDAPSEERPGLDWLDGGVEAYAASLRFFTTTDLSAQQIHDLGLAQVERLADEYRALGPEAVGTDDLDALFTAMRSDPELHFSTADEIVEQSRVCLARAEAAAPDWFEVLPQAPCEVEGTEGGMLAFYFPPAADGSRDGTFFVNVSDPPGWGRFELEALAYHEGVPGHHLQLSLASELSGSLPKLQRHLDVASYTEGWGLYAERLADEMGLYPTPLARMGMLSGDSMRACRLVVDTGLHALGWSRRQAIDYVLANSPFTEAMTTAEIDRYVCYPGQATAYMIGRLEIQRIRAEAEHRQGDRFDIRKFHSAVLDSGALPLDVLDRVVTARLP